MNLPKNPFRRKYNINKDTSLAFERIKKLLNQRVVKWFLGLLAFFIITPIILFLILRPTVHPNIKYGVTFSKKYAEEIGLDWKSTYIKILDDLGVDHVRVVAYWDDIEENKDQYNFYDVYWQLEEARKRDIDAILVVGRKVPRWPECFEPKWWHEIDDQTVKDHELYEYVKRTVITLKGFENIKMWQVENEPFFPFGHCTPEITKEVLKNEIDIVRSLDDRPIIIQDSGEGGLWRPTYNLGDYLAISMYRKIWFDFWGVLLGNSVYFKYPLGHWTYKVKANLVGIPIEKMVVTELQAEPWGPTINVELTEEQKSRTMSRNDFLDTLSYAQKSGFSEFYLWGAEWWLWEKEQNGNSFYWDTAKALFN